MNLVLKTIAALSPVVVAGLLIAAPPASAGQVCGWYVIAFCSQDSARASDFANDGWGSVIDTSDYRGFAPDNFCVVSGPQSKKSAQRDRRAAIRNGIARDAYIKRACTDAGNVGD